MKNGVHPVKGLAPLFVKLEADPLKVVDVLGVVDEREELLPPPAVVVVPGPVPTPVPGPPAPVLRPVDEPVAPDAPELAPLLDAPDEAVGVTPDVTGAWVEIVAPPAPEILAGAALLEGVTGLAEAAPPEDVTGLAEAAPPEDVKKLAGPARLVGGAVLPDAVVAVALVEPGRAAAVAEDCTAGSAEAVEAGPLAPQAVEEQ